MLSINVFILSFKNLILVSYSFLIPIVDVFPNLSDFSFIFVNIGIILIFFGPIADYADDNISIIPDFISNCGMARVFAYLMSNDLDKLVASFLVNFTSNIFAISNIICIFTDVVAKKSTTGSGFTSITPPVIQEYLFIIFFADNSLC